MSHDQFNSIHNNVPKGDSAKSKRATAPKQRHPCLCSFLQKKKYSCMLQELKKDEECIGYTLLAFYANVKRPLDVKTAAIAKKEKAQM